MQAVFALIATHLPLDRCFRPREALRLTNALPSVRATFKYISVYEHLFSSYVLILTSSSNTCEHFASPIGHISKRPHFCHLGNQCIFKDGCRLPEARRRQTVSYLSAQWPPAVHVWYAICFSKSQVTVHSGFAGALGQIETVAALRPCYVIITVGLPSSAVSQAPTGPWVWGRAAGLTVTLASVLIPAPFICLFKQLTRVKDCRLRAIALISGQVDLVISAFSKSMTQWRGHCALCPPVHCDVLLSIQELLCPILSQCFLVAALLLST